MTLQNVVPWGRNLDEYRAMFALSDADLRTTILGCADGPSSFNAEATAQGAHVISIDPVYQFHADAIKQRISETATTVLQQVQEHHDTFVWNSIPSIDALEQIRMAAMQQFLEDYDQGKTVGRYMEASLPEIPFSDKRFDTVLCSHFLFLYSGHLDLEFHIAAVHEMCRVGNDIRIFPLVDLQGATSPHLEPLMQHFEGEGFKCNIVEVDYEFQKGGRHMLRITPQLER